MARSLARPRTTWDHRRRSRWPAALLCLNLGSIGYFAAHALAGRHGLASRSALIARAAVLASAIERLEVNRGLLRADVAALGAEPPDPDVIEEIAADLFGFVRRGDRIVVGLPPRGVR